MEKLYSISDLENLTGIKAHTIRIWEKRYSIFNPIRTDTNIRKYTHSDLKKLSNIAYLNSKGIKISVLSKMGVLELDQTVKASITDEMQETSITKKLLEAVLVMDANDAHAVISEIEKEIGFKKAMYQIVFPFLNKIGLLWAAGSIKPSQEHFISSIVKQRIIAEISKIEKNTGKKKILLYAPEDELHEIGLLFSQYLCHKAGHSTLYLGQKTPLDDLSEVIFYYKPDAVITSLTMPASLVNTLKMIDFMNTVFADKTDIFLCGPRFYEVKNEKKYPENNFFINSFQDLEKKLNLL